MLIRERESGFSEWRFHSDSPGLTHAGMVAATDYNVEVNEFSLLATLGTQIR